MRNENLFDWDKLALCLKSLLHKELIDSSISIQSLSTETGKTQKCINKFVLKQMGNINKCLQVWN